MDTKITAEHLQRTAYVYIRQSTPGQVRNNQESRRRQYALKDHAKQLGWNDVEVIDEDQGHSGSGTAARSGFDRLLGAICDRKVGAVIGLEISRLARNGREWHTLMEFCGIVGTLVIDEHGVYDPRLPNDRLLLGMKSTMAEMELATFRQRSIEARKLKASRGELYCGEVAVGYIRNGSGGLDKDSDLRIQAAVKLILEKFDELGSVRKVFLWHVQEELRIPCHVHREGAGVRIEWNLPTYSMILGIIRNPVYAGAYVFGRRSSKVTLENGHKRISQTAERDPEKWGTFIKDHHESYISWEIFEHNQLILANNTNMHGEQVQGSIRCGVALLAGLLRCGHCGHKVMVAYSRSNGSTGTGHGRYSCHDNKRDPRLCISFGALSVDNAVSTEVLRRLQPLGIEAALQAIEDHKTANSDVRRQVELALEQARYEASLARRQYDAVDPLNRLVAAELERRWNDRLLVVAELENKLANLANSETQGFTETEREELLCLGADLERAWNHPGASAETRKRILRTVIKEIVVRVEGDQVYMKLHWHGGDHTELVVKRNRIGQNRFVVSPDTIDLIRALARVQSDPGIASTLNRMGIRTGKGNTWNAVRVCSFRQSYSIDVYRDGERAERGEVTVEEAAQLLQVNQMVIFRLIQRKVLPAYHACAGAPWSIRRIDLDLPAVQKGIESGALTANPNQQGLDFSVT